MIFRADVSFPQLKFTRIECDDLEKLAKGVGWATQKLMGERATEEAVSNVDSPGVLHLATHGFFLSEPSLEKDGAGNALSGQGRMIRETLANPMHRSGVALAGAQNTIANWKEGRVPSFGSDGILTAQEAGSL